MITLRVRNVGLVKDVAELFYQLEEKLKDGWTVLRTDEWKQKPSVRPFLKVSLTKEGHDTNETIDVRAPKVVAATVEESPRMTEQEAAEKQAEEANTDAGKDLQEEKDAVVEAAKDEELPEEVIPEEAPAEKPKAKAKSKPKTKGKK